VRPVLTVAEMREVDAKALMSVSEAVLVERAGTAVATCALQMLGGAYGRRVVVVAGKGNNGADGRVAAERLRRRGARVEVIDAARAPDRIAGTAGTAGTTGTAGTAGTPVDLVIDAAYGTGFRGSYIAPCVPAGVRVLAVDIPSGVNGDTGEVSGEPLRADVTVTFAALKPGLLQGDGPALCGDVQVADIGLDSSTAGIWLIEDADVVRLIPERSRDANKWQSGVVVVAGSPGMLGAASFCSTAAYRAGAGMVRLAVPGASASELPAMEAVGFEVPRTGWAADVLEMAKRCRVVVIGPGIGRDSATRADVRQVAKESPVPVVVDADGLFALGSAADVLDVARGRRPGAGPIVLTPHAGEFAQMFGHAPGVDRVAEAREASKSAGCIVLLKGPTTVVAGPGGGAPATSTPAATTPAVRVVTSGGPNLATAGTGDVLSGAIGAFIARGAEPLEATALAAHAHGRAAGLGPAVGLVAGDLADLLARWLSGQVHSA